MSKPDLNFLMNIHLFLKVSILEPKYQSFCRRVDYPEISGVFSKYNHMFSYEIAKYRSNKEKQGVMKTWRQKFHCFSSYLITYILPHKSTKFIAAASFTVL
jgi:hypothetical protein